MKDFYDVGRASAEALAAVSKAELDTAECKSGAEKRGRRRLQCGK